MDTGTAKIQPIKTRHKATPPAHESLSSQRFWTGAGVVMAILLGVLYFLAVRNQDTFSLVMILLCLAIFVLPPFMIAYQSHQTYRRALLLEQCFVMDLGRVISLYDEDVTLGDQASSMVYWMVFQLSSGEIIKQNVSQTKFRQLSIGQQVSIRVSPDNRLICRVEFED